MLGGSSPTKRTARIVGNSCPASNSTLPVSGQRTAAEITCSARDMSRAEESFWGQAQPETKLSKLKTVPVEKSEIPCS